MRYQDKGDENMCDNKDTFTEEIDLDDWLDGEWIPSYEPYTEEEFFQSNNVLNGNPIE